MNDMGDGGDPRKRADEHDDTTAICGICGQPCEGGACEANVCECCRSATEAEIRAEKLRAAMEADLRMALHTANVLAFVNQSIRGTP